MTDSTADIGNVIDFPGSSCDQCHAMRPEEDHAFFCRQGVHPTDMNYEQMELIDRLLSVTHAVIVFPDGHRYWCKFCPTPPSQDI